MKQDDNGAPIAALQEFRDLCDKHGISGAAAFVVCDPQPQGGKLRIQTTLKAAAPLLKEPVRLSAVLASLLNGLRVMGDQIAATLKSGGYGNNP